MDMLSQVPGLFLGVIGWAATAKLIYGSSLTGFWQRSALIVFTWMLWMVPAFDIIVYQGLMPAETAVTYCATMTGALAFVISLGALGRRSKH